MRSLEYSCVNAAHACSSFLGSEASRSCSTTAGRLGITPFHMAAEAGCQAATARTAGRKRRVGVSHLEDRARSRWRLSSLGNGSVGVSRRTSVGTAPQEKRGPKVKRLPGADLL